VSVSLTDRQQPKLLPVNLAARRLRVPVKWLREEAEAGRIPHLKAGKQILVHPPSVEATLLERAKSEEGSK